MTKFDLSLWILLIYGLPQGQEPLPRRYSRPRQWQKQPRTLNPGEISIFLTCGEDMTTYMSSHVKLPTLAPRGWD